MPDDENQQLSYNSVPISQDSVQTLYIQKERLVIPIIFIPGVMGSNLKVKHEEGKDEKTERVWRLDSKQSVLGWGLWISGGAKARKNQLDPDKTEVDYRGKVVDAAEKEIAIINNQFDKQIKKLGRFETSKLHKTFQIRKQKIEEAIKNNPENHLFGTRNERGWGSVSYISYGEFLETLQTSLFDSKGHLSSMLYSLTKEKSFTLEQYSKVTLTFVNEQIKHCESFYLPVHVMGYNWLESNDVSAQKLKTLVEQTLPIYYKKRGKICNKVIIVTHSMGGLVARYYTQNLGGQERVLGVINGVQPSIGAAAAYTRMKRGTEAYGGGKVINWITANILGKDAAEMTAVCAQAPGPLQLLPMPEYGKKWLTITDPDGTSESYPKIDPYAEIYLSKDKWWCVCEPHLINPNNKKHNLTQMQSDWEKYKILIYKKVKPFHQKIANKYHPNTYVFFGIADDENNIKQETLTYNVAHWIGQFNKDSKNNMRNPPTDHIGASNRLYLWELNEIRTLATERHNWVEDKKHPYYQNIFAKRIIGNISEIYTLQKAKGNGDGTVPQCSGEIPIDKIKARMHLPVEHEPAYQSSISQEFTLRAIIDILQQAKIDD